MTEDIKPTNSDLLAAITKLDENMDKKFKGVNGRFDKLWNNVKEEFEAIDGRLSDLEFKLNLEESDIRKRAPEFYGTGELNIK